MADINNRVASMFAIDTADHKLTILHDDGLYRHIRMARPGTSIARYELVTWPGHLAVGGDIDGYVFARTEDMFTFFRGKHINPGYWAEKITDGRERAKRYSEDMLIAVVKDRIADFEESYPERLAWHTARMEEWEAAGPDGRYPYASKGVRHPGSLWSPEEAREALADAESDGSTMSEEGARELLEHLEGHGVISDASEINLSDWDFHYLYCLHAIVAGIRAYDAAKVPAQ
jgi:hypothetical protein